MQSALVLLRVHVDVLCQAAAPLPGRKAPGKQERLRAAIAVNDALSRESTVNGLTAASKLEMVRGPQQDAAGPTPLLGWAELSAVMVETLNQVFSEAVKSKSTLRSRSANLKPTYMVCFRSILKFALANGPPGVIRPIVPAFLFFAHSWLSEPILREVAGDQIWQCVRDILRDDENRAMLTPPFIRTWVDVCVEQLTGRGPLNHPSLVVWKFAADVLEIIATGCRNYDTLSQSTKSTAPRKMLGGDFGYAIICERCCLMLLIAESLEHQKARALQAVAFRTLSVALSEHSIDVVGSNALKSVIHVSPRPLMLCWKDRRHHDVAVTMARVLIMLAPSHRVLLDLLRERIGFDMRDNKYHAILEGGKDGGHKLIDVIAACFSLRECLEFSGITPNSQPRTLIWLQAAHLIISGQTLKKGMAVLPNAPDVSDQCMKAVETVSTILLGQEKSRERLCGDIVRVCAGIVDGAALLANEIESASATYNSCAAGPWQNLYLVLREQFMRWRNLTQVRGSVYTTGTRSLSPAHRLLQTLSFLSTLSLIQDSTLDCIYPQSDLHQGAPFKVFGLTRSGGGTTALEVEYFRNLVARIGLPNSTGDHLRFRVVHSLVNVCEKTSLQDQSSVDMVLDASSAAFGLARGQCSCVDSNFMNARHSKKASRFSSSLNHRAFEAFQRSFGLSTAEQTVKEVGGTLVSNILDQEIWARHPNLGRGAQGKKCLASEVFSVLEGDCCSLRGCQSLGQEFSVPAEIAESIENLIASQMTTARTETVTPTLTDDPSLQELSAAPLLRTSSEKCTTRHLGDEAEVIEAFKSLLFIGKYLLLGVGAGIVSVTDVNQSAKGTSLRSLARVLLNLCEYLSARKAVVILRVPYGGKEVLKTLLGLHSVLDQSFRVSTAVVSETELLWRDLQKVISTCVTSLCNSLTRHLCVSLISRVNANFEKVQQYSTNSLLDPVTNEIYTSKKQKRKTPPKIPSATKRRKLRHVPNVHRSSDEDGSITKKREAPSESKNWSENGDWDSAESDIERLDDFYSTEVLQRPAISARQFFSSKGSESTIRLTAELIRVCIDELPGAGDGILDICLHGLKKVEDCERVFSPDGFERASMYSYILDSCLFENILAVWGVLSDLKTSGAIEVVGKGIHNLGMRWRELERISFEYTSFYIESLEITTNSRKHYPMVLWLEKFRILFLDQARVFATHCSSQIRSHVAVSGGALVYKRSSAPVHLIGSIVKVAEHFRQEHAFRMPRETRIAYIRFAIAAVELVQKSNRDLGFVLERQPDQLSALYNGVIHMQSALCKSMADSEALVRIAAALVMPRLLVTYSDSTLSKLEDLIQDSIPQNNACEDSPIFFGCRSPSDLCNETGNDSVDKHFELSEHEQSNFSSIQSSFRKIGARAKLHTSYIALGEVAFVREDLLPFCIVQFCERVFVNPESSASAYHVIGALCASLGFNSPCSFYQAYSRLIVPKWFAARDGSDRMDSIPVALFVDTEHHGAHILYDWMRDQQSLLLPEILVRDEYPELPHAENFASALGIDLHMLLSSNIGSVALVYPMQFTARYHDIGKELWKAIDIVLKTKSTELMFENKWEVLRSFLFSTSSGYHKFDRSSSGNVFADGIPGFSRDTRNVPPPCYDPLIVALTINQLFEPAMHLLISVPRNVLQGSLFAQVRDEANGQLIADAFNGFLEECRRGKLTLLRVLFNVRLLLCGPPHPQPRQHRVDGYFCVAMLWRMLGVNALAKSSTERVLFYRLIAAGFELKETAQDAVWLLGDVQRKVSMMYKTCTDVNVSVPDLCPDASVHDYLLCLTTSRERQMFELLSTVSSTLVSIADVEDMAKDPSEGTELLQSAALKALHDLLTLCQQEEMWTVVVCNGPFPATASFMQAAEIYKSSKERAESGSPADCVRSAIDALHRFEGVYRMQRGSQSTAATAACLDELGSILTSPVIKQISLKIKREAWVRSDGQEEATTPYIRRAIASLINLIYEAGSDFSYHSTCSQQWAPEKVGEIAAREVETKTRAVYNASGNVLGVLGLLHSQSATFICSNTHHRSIPTLGELGSYENVDSGIRTSLLSLVGLFRSSSAITAEAALMSLVEVLRTEDGKRVFSQEKRHLGVVFPFRVAARKLDVRLLPATDLLTVDPDSGNFVNSNSFPGLLTTQLWNPGMASKTKPRSSEFWLRRLCSVLSTHCISDALQMLSPPCFASYSFSCEMLPYMLMDIVDDPDAKSVSEVSSLIRKYILVPENIQVEVVRIFVHALDRLCQIGLQKMRANGIDQRFFAKDDRSQLRTLYVYDIPYSEVARAALRSGLYFSVVRFAQMHIDHVVAQQERETTGRSSSSLLDRRHSSHPPRDASIEHADEAARDSVRELVREALTQINESDGVRAFGRHDCLSVSAADLAILDKDWARSLGSLDVVSRNFSRVSDAVGNSWTEDKDGSEYSSGVNLRREISIFKSFIGLGTLSIAADYSNGLQNRIPKVGIEKRNSFGDERGSLVSSLNDLQYAVAWKLGHWDTPPVVLPNSSFRGDYAGKGYHETIHQVLVACCTSRGESVSRLLSWARISELRRLVRNNSGVSATTISQCAARLCTFRIFEESYRQHGGVSPSSTADPFHTRNVAGSRVPQASNRFTIAEPLDVVKSMSTGFYGIDGTNGSSGEVDLCRNAFDECILADDLPISIIRCLDRNADISSAATTVSTRLLLAGGSGSWARSSACLGTPSSIRLSEAPKVDQIAWKLQEARLRWAASHDAVSKKQALGRVKEIISRELGGQDSRNTSNAGSSRAGGDLAFQWNNQEESNEKYALLRSEACRLAAEWSLDMKTHEPINLFETFLESALRAVRADAVARGFSGRVHFSMATFADAQISNIDAYRATTKYNEMVAAITERESEIEDLKSLKKGQTSRIKASSRKKSVRSSRSELATAVKTSDQIGKDLSALIAIEQKKATQERVRLQQLQASYQKWQVLACKHFAASLREGSMHDLRAAFRMTALWLDSGSMREVITRALLSTNEDPTRPRSIEVPVSKLLPLAPQLSSRLTVAENVGRAVFQNSLSSTIQQLAERFPPHCLWQLLALSNATRVSANQEKYSSLYRGDQDKKTAADQIIDQLQSVHGPTVTEMRGLAEAYIMLSEVSDNEKNGTSLSLKGKAITRLGALANVPIPTLPLPFMGDDFCPILPHVVSFETKAIVCAGLSKPLKVVCHGSDGKRYPQIVKGKDDLRGDAVMEQMFAILNSLLEKDQNASERNLLVRTYRIIPLSPFSGIMQFVRNTSQLKNVLVDRTRQIGSSTTVRSLHERYRPKDLKHEVVSNKAFEYRAPQQLQKRLGVLARLWQKIQPVFRHFFLERWPDPAEWYSHQLAYARSVAVMSIVGFILGLGDRHLSNILVDVVTGEVVHIDFGIAFELGKLLPTPEHMPFRLTRDIVDGFGIAGVEGVFRRCSETTLAVMRQNKDVLLTVVEVLLHDPMFNWALTPEEVLREQLGNGQDELIESDEFSRSFDATAAAKKVSKDLNGSREARGALSRITEKLEGLEGTERLSVEAHVARLVDEAQAFHVIASVYPGWAPWI